MTWQIKAGIYLLLASAIFLAGCYVTRDHYQVRMAEREAEWSKAIEAATQAQLEQVSAHDKLKHYAEIIHGQDQIIINNLRNRIADGMPMHIPACGSAADQTSAADTDPDRTAGIFSARVDELFAELQGRIDRLAFRCDQLNIDARRVNGEVGDN